MEAKKPPNSGGEKVKDNLSPQWTGIEAVG